MNEWVHRGIIINPLTLTFSFFLVTHSSQSPLGNPRHFSFVQFSVFKEKSTFAPVCKGDSTMVTRGIYHVGFFFWDSILLSLAIVVYLTNKVSKVSIMPFSFQEAFNHPHCTHLDTTHNPIDQGSSSLVINIKHTHDNTQLLY